MNARSLISSEHEAQTAPLDELYEHADTLKLVKLVNDAAELIHVNGETALDELRVSGSRWRNGESYVFVIDPKGAMLVHPDAEMEGTRQLGLLDVGGKPIIRGLINAATAISGKSDGWYHYQWPAPGELLPRWKSSYVRLVTLPSERSYIVGSGMYNDRMERAFVVDMVTNAVGEIGKRGEEAFELFRDASGPFIAKDAYIFVIDMDGIEVVNPAFPSIEGRNLLDLKDTEGKYLDREIIAMARTHGTGWVDYMWPKPGESVATRKSAYVSAARVGDRPVVVGCGVYLTDAPREAGTEPSLSAAELMSLVRDAAAVLEEKGASAYPELRKDGSRWLRDDTYLFVFTSDGTRAFHAVEPESEGRNDSKLLDVLGRPIVRMILDAAAGPSGDGWVHYMYPQPGGLFPAWKSAFVKRVTFPSGEQHIVGAGIYNMRMDREFIEDVVSRAAALVEERGEGSFPLLRDRTGPFVFMDTYVFVQGADGTELVNPAQPSLEGRNLMELKDLQGRPVVRDQMAALENADNAWVDCYWYRPGDNVPALKQTYVRKVRSGEETYIVGSGIYAE